MDAMAGWEAQRAQLRPPPAYPRNFTCTNVDVYCPPGSKGATTLKKTRKDKRDSHNSRPLLDDNPRKLKERPSWLGISRQPSSNLTPAGCWRQVTCNLQDDTDQAILRLYTEDQHLQHSVQVDALFAPNLRIIDPTLLMRRHVLAIHAHSPPGTSSASVSTTSPAPPEPIYLSFRDRDTLNTWFVLLRSFARPDIRPYPPSTYSPPPPAPYRVWRHLQVTIIAGRKFPVASALEKGASDECAPPKDQDMGPDKDIFDIFLEVVVNGVPVGRTGTKQIPGPPWQEERIVVHDPDLGGGNWAGSNGISMDPTTAILEPTWGTPDVPGMNGHLLEVRVWRARPMLFGPSAQHIATVPVDLGPFRRGEPVKAWWPGYPAGGRGFQDGELMMEIKFDEEMVMPLDMYHKMKAILSRRNYFELWQDIMNRVPVPNSVSSHFISLAQHHATLAPHLSALACTEIDDSRASPTTLFRGNSTLTRIAESAMSLLGARRFLEASLGSVIRGVYREKVMFDLGTNGPSGVIVVGGVAAATEGAELMAKWLQDLWNSIWRARGECPEELRQLFYQIRIHVERRWGNSQDHADLKYQAISAFLFLRFFVPAILRPDKHGLVVGPPPEGVEKSLKSLARAIQSLANLNTSTLRDEFMRSVKTFYENNVDAMIDYLIFVSTPSERSLSSPTIHPHVHHQHHLPPQGSEIHTALRIRSSAMTAIQRESLGVLPYLSDEAKDFAAIASAIVRNARAPNHLRPMTKTERDQEVGSMDESLDLESGGVGYDTSVPRTGEPPGENGDFTESQLDALRFIKACFDVEAEAMRRVSPLAVRKKQARRRRRPKLEERLAPTSEERNEVAVEATTSSVSVESPRSLEARRAMQLPVALSMAGMSTYGSLPIAITELGAKPEIARQMSHTVATGSATIEAAGSKKRKGVLWFKRG